MEEQKLLKTLRNKDVIALAFGSMIGWGWVVNAGIWITKGGSLGSIIAFLIGGLMVILVGLTYSELAAALPLAGGELIYTFKAMGRTFSFIATWAVILGYVSVIGFEAVALPTVFEYLIPNYSQGYLYTVAGWDVTFTWAGVGILGSIIIAWVNYRGIKLTSAITVILTGLILAAGVLLIIGGTASGSIRTMEPFFPEGMTGVMTVIIMTPFMFVGFDVIPQAAEEINLPQKRIGQLLIVSVVMAVAWYIAIIFGVSRMLGPTELSESTLVTADAMAKAFGDSRLMGNFLVLGGIGGILTSWLGFYVGGSRAIYALAKAGMLPKSLGDLHPKYNTPYKAIILIAIISTLSPLLGRQALLWFQNAGGLGLVLAWMMVAISFIVLRKKSPNMKRPFRLAGGTTIGWLAVVMSIGIFILYLPGMPSALAWPYEWVIIIAWTIIGIILYRVSLVKYGTTHAEEHIKKEIDRIQ